MPNTFSSRSSSSFELKQPDGLTKTYEIVPYITPDDLMVLGAKAAAAEVKYGVRYVSPSPRAARDNLILTRVTNRS